MATTTSAVATSFFTISRPSGFIGFSVRPRLLRPSCRNMAPSPVSVTGDEAVFRAVNFFDSDDVGTKICQECRAIRACDIAPEVQHPDALNTLLMCLFPVEKLKQRTIGNPPGILSLPQEPVQPDSRRLPAMIHLSILLVMGCCGFLSPAGVRYTLEVKRHRIIPRTPLLSRS